MKRMFSTLRSSLFKQPAIPYVTPKRWEENTPLKDRSLDEYQEMLTGTERVFFYESEKTSSAERGGEAPAFDADIADKMVLQIGAGRTIPYARHALARGAAQVVVFGPALREGLHEPIRGTHEKGETYRDIALRVLREDSATKDKEERLKLVFGYGENMGELPSNSFDKILSCFGVPMYCNEIAGKTNFFRHLWRLMRPGAEARFYPCSQKDAELAIDTIQTHGKHYGKHFEVALFKTLPPKNGHLMETVNHDSQFSRLLVIRKLV